MEAHARPPAGLALHLQIPPELEGSMAHRVLTDTDPGLRGVEPATVVGHLRAGEVAGEPQPHLDAPSL